MTPSPSFADNSELEYEFFLAEKLGRTVGELRDSITQDEFIRWQMYHGRQAQRRELELAKGRG